jgi:hypothetical protein
MGTYARTVLIILFILYNYNNTSVLTLIPGREVLIVQETAYLVGWVNWAMVGGIVTDTFYLGTSPYVEWAGLVPQS